MYKVIFDLLIVTFAIYGMVMFVIQVFGRSLYRKQPDSCMVKTVIFMKGEKDTVEGMIRGIAFDRVMCDGLAGEVYIVGKEWDQETRQILRRLESEYGFIKVIDDTVKSNQLNNLLNCT